MTEDKYILYLILRVCDDLGFDPEKYRDGGSLVVKPFMEDLLVSDQVGDDVKARGKALMESIEKAARGNGRNANSVTIVGNSDKRELAKDYKECGRMRKTAL